MLKDGDYDYDCDYGDDYDYDDISLICFVIPVCQRGDAVDVHI